MPNVTVTFQMRNGKELRCEYGYTYWAGNYWNPPESDIGEPTYYIGDKEVAYKELPKGLDQIADDMYENGESDSRFKYIEHPDVTGYD